jgi:preprotein translocase subunit SecD
MSNKSKGLLVLAVILFGFLIALPNVFAVDQAVHISRDDGESLQEATLDQIATLLTENDIEYLGVEMDEDAGIVRFADEETRVAASEFLGEQLPGYVVAVTLAPRTPAWMRSIGLEPMNLGLDLRGGVHFLYQVDLDVAIERYLNVYLEDLQEQLRDERIRHTARVSGTVVTVEILQPEFLERAGEIIRRIENDPLQQRLRIEQADLGANRGFRIEMTEALIREREDFAIEQNTVTLRNRVNELGVSEPIVQRQGRDRILVQLPGVQDPGRAKVVLGATATLEFRLNDYDADPYEVVRRGRAPLGSELHYDRSGNPVVLRREFIVSGDQLVDATPTYQQGLPAVSIRLNQQGARRMLETTQANVGRNMAVLFIEETPILEGDQIVGSDTREEVISNPVIRGVFGSNFVIEGLTPFEAQNLALQLRAGSLATPIVIVEERTIGPSLGAQNIEKGRLAVVIGFLLVVVYMGIYYRLFGMVANLALFANVVLIIALLSLVQAALTLPGIAGIVLTVGMAVDANVLIFERIREELRNGNSPLASIRAGYDKAFSTIADANITTLIAALVLFFFGTGPIKGFAITLMFGIVTSMFTAIVGTRVVVDLIYTSKKRIDTLSIGMGRSHATV